MLYPYTTFCDRCRIRTYKTSLNVQLIFKIRPRTNGVRPTIYNYSLQLVKSTVITKNAGRIFYSYPPHKQTPTTINEKDAVCFLECCEFLTQYWFHLLVSLNNRTGEVLSLYVHLLTIRCVLFSLDGYLFLSRKSDSNGHRPTYQVGTLPLCYCGN